MINLEAFSLSRILVENLIEFFKTNYSDLYMSMIECNHGTSNRINPMHQEGDVWKHTEMVIDAVENKNNLHVILAALLHDIGKPMVREIYINRDGEELVRFFNHNAFSTFYAIDILENIQKNLPGFEYFNKFAVLNLIHLHDMIFVENKKTDNVNEIADVLYRKLGGYGNEFINDLLMLSFADNIGRISENANSSRMYLEDLARIVNSHKILKKVNVATNYSNSVLFTVGLPYSGKTTLLNKIRCNYSIVSRDDVIMELSNGKLYHDAWKDVNQDIVTKIFDLRLNDAIAQQKDIAIDMTHMSVKARKNNLQRFSDKYKKIAWVFYIGLPEINRRIKTRTDKIVSWEVIKTMMSKYALPTFEEFDEIWFIDKNDDSYKCSKFNE